MLNFLVKNKEKLRFLKKKKLGKFKSRIALFCYHVSDKTKQE